MVPHITDREIAFLKLWAKALTAHAKAMACDDITEWSTGGYLDALKDVAREVFGDSFLDDLINHSGTGDG